MPSEVVSPPETLKRTALYPLHAELAARFCSFAGWELPVYYSSILQEHQAVRSAAGLFDVSHLGHVEVSGAGATAHLQLLVTQDLERVEPGRAVYTPMLTPRGWILDEMILYRLAPDRFRLVVNAANGEKVLGWLRGKMGAAAAVEDLRDRVGTVALQGPKAAEILQGVCPHALASLPRYAVAESTAAGRPCRIARTGYTGEDGCEIFAAVQDLPEIWRAFLDKGRPLGLQPAGLGARDTLRLEAGLVLGGADLDERTTPLEAGLDWTVDWRKGPFIGREMLERQRREGVTRRLVGFELRGPGVPRPGCPILRGEEKVGVVTSGSMVGGRAIGMGYVPPASARPGARILIGIHQRRVEAEVVKLPFYRRPKS
ncbi:MAG: glycine cleavage system aminomethyltransferase GcvT [Candidatus Omnitrophica bacterium]|nr:glycine cleavage system aminomethyltransferase GcvT [Candidatus Omnitrophota bacterium]